MIIDYLIKYIIKTDYLDQLLNSNEKYIFVLACYLGFIALLYGLTEVGIISIGSFILGAILTLGLYFIFKKQLNKTIKRLRKENDTLKINDEMGEICKGAQNEFCDRYNKKLSQYKQDVNGIYKDYNKAFS